VKIFFGSLNFSLTFVAPNKNKSNMSTTSSDRPFVNFRDAILEMQEVGESINAFGYAHRLMVSLRTETITSSEFDGLIKELKFYCQRNRVETKNEICSLF
jgi:hypothetical protein